MAPKAPKPAPGSNGLNALGIGLLIMALLGVLGQTVWQLRLQPPDESLESAAGLMVSVVVYLMLFIWFLTRNRHS